MLEGRCGAAHKGPDDQFSCPHAGIYRKMEGLWVMVDVYENALERDVNYLQGLEEFCLKASVII